jgi:hypothetical protein
MAFVLPPPVAAQLHWDVDAEAGVRKRFTTGSDPGAPNPGFGPAFELQGHVAVFPMVRVGAYLAQDTSYASGIGPRTFWEGGLHVKVTPPLLPSPWRTWVSAGVGYAYTYAASYTQTIHVANGSVDESVDHVTGGMIDVPLAVALGYRLRAPASSSGWTVFAELGGRIGAAFFGAMYGDGAPGSAPGVPPIVAPFMGKDSFALSLTLGLSYGE